VLIAACGLAGSCQRGLSNDEFQLLLTWLTCDECLMQEREEVAALGERVIPFLVEAFDSLPGGRRELQRERYRQLHATLTAPTRSPTDFVEHYLDAFDETVRTRIALSLGDLEAWNAIADLRARALAAGYGASVTDLLTAQELREPGALEAGPGPASTWTLVEPGDEVLLCNGDGALPCPGDAVTELAARATLPSSSVPAPFTMVAFYTRASAARGPAHLIAVASAPAVTDDGVERHWTWTTRLSGAGLAPGPIELFAAGVSSAGQAFSTAPNTEVTVVERN
jgi:hypothetical protein